MLDWKSLEDASNVVSSVHERATPESLETQSEFGETIIISLHFVFNILALIVYRLGVLDVLKKNID